MKQTQILPQEADIPAEDFPRNSSSEGVWGQISTVLITEGGRGKAVTISKTWLNEFGFYVHIHSLIGEYLLSISCSRHLLGGRIE